MSRCCPRRQIADYEPVPYRPPQPAKERRLLLRHASIVKITDANDDRDVLVTCVIGPDADVDGFLDLVCTVGGLDLGILARQVRAMFAFELGDSVLAEAARPDVLAAAVWAELRPFVAEDGAVAA